MENQFDLVVIGSGPGGYVGAIRAAQLGLKVAIIEKDKNFGGTCLNVGCIPSKALLESSEQYHAAHTNLKSHGVSVTGIELNLATMMARKDKVVSDSNNGVKFLFKKNKITALTGFGKILKAGSVELKKDDGSTEVISTKFIVIATGSIPTELPFLKFDEKKILS